MAACCPTCGAIIAAHESAILLGVHQACLLRHTPLVAVFKKRPTRIGVLPRYAESGAEVRWFDTGGCMPSWPAVPGRRRAP